METVIDQKQKLVLWKTAIALQAVDGLKVSDDFMEIAKQNIEGKLSAEKVATKVKKHDDENHTNLVAARMFAVLSAPQEDFILSQDQLFSIHNELFEDILENAGELRQKNIAKKEWALDGKVLLYPEAKDIPNLLNEIFAKENEFNFDGMDSDSIAKHVAEFISQLWQIHPFEKFNTRTIAIFLAQYIEHLGYALDNDAIARNPVYFRNALVRAVYNEPEEGIEADTKYLELLMQNILCGASHSLNYKTIHLNYVDEEGVAIKDADVIANDKTIIANEETVIAKKATAEEKPKRGRAKKTDSEKKSPAKKTAAKKPSEKKSAPKKPRAKKPKVTETGVRIKLPEEIEAEKLAAAKAAEQKEAAKKSAPKKTAAPKKPRAKKVSDISEEKKEKILAYLHENKSITNSQAREVIDSSTETARKILVKLADEGIVTAQGANRNRVYILN